MSSWDMFVTFILIYILYFWQPIGALLLEQCRVEKEDSQSFSVGELQHPVFPFPDFPFLLLLTKLVIGSLQCCLSVTILVIALCDHKKFCVSAWSISWWSREEISVWMWLRGAVCGVGGCHYQGQVAYLLFLSIKRQHIQVCMVHVSISWTPSCYRLVILISCSYEFMRKNLIFYRTEIHRLTGKVRLSKLDSGRVNPVKMVGG